MELQNTWFEGTSEVIQMSLGSLRKEIHYLFGKPVSVLNYSHCGRTASSTCHRHLFCCSLLLEKFPLVISLCTSDQNLV